MNLETLKEQIYYQIQLVNKDLYTKFEFCVGSSPSRTEILKFLYENGKIAQMSLQKKLNIDKAAITRHLKQLEASNYIERTKEDKDQRVTWVELTSSTKEEIDYLFKQRERFLSEILADFSYEQLKVFYEMLNTMQDNILKTTK
ncbi:MarR family transcriptional regulator [Paenibacillus sp. P96]|uniref:MarR family transcriptional regulator n=1 Tax=Paenibacillus zeirhizosphaerae TaxID=2987519 RepID=A0ABT9FPP4_9BACL|nr:MarR family transcriptional regulator [Paenibacillus sp. P96]MDP4096696.1 MarR family transcriptional regulator [Paenibacillus sp. P96]